MSPRAGPGVTEESGKISEKGGKRTRRICYTRSGEAPALFKEGFTGWGLRKERKKRIPRKVGEEAYLYNLSLGMPITPT